MKGGFRILKSNWNGDQKKNLKNSFFSETQRSGRAVVRERLSLLKSHTQAVDCASWNDEHPARLVAPYKSLAEIWQTEERK
jgi:hypothetical protein